MKVDLTISPNICNQDRHEGGGAPSKYFQSRLIRGGIVSHESVAESGDISLSAAWILQDGTGANLQVDERCRNTVAVNVDLAARRYPQQQRITRQMIRLPLKPQAVRVRRPRHRRRPPVRRRCHAGAPGSCAASSPPRSESPARRNPCRGGAS